MIEFGSSARKQTRMLERTVSLMHLISSLSSIEEEEESIDKPGESEVDDFRRYSQYAVTVFGNCYAPQKGLDDDLFLESLQDQELQHKDLPSKIESENLNKMEKGSLTKNSTRLGESVYLGGHSFMGSRMLGTSNVTTENTVLASTIEQTDEPEDNNFCKSMVELGSSIEPVYPNPQPQTTEEQPKARPSPHRALDLVIPSVARGPQPTCVEPTRYLNGERIRPRAPAAKAAPNPAQRNGAAAQPSSGRRDSANHVRAQPMNPTVNHSAQVFRNNENMMRNKVGNCMVPMHPWVQWNPKCGRPVRGQNWPNRPPVSPQQSKKQVPPLMPGQLNMGAGAGGTGAPEGYVRVRPNCKPKVIRTTVGNDSSWINDLIYTTWVETPKASNKPPQNLKQLSKPISNQNIVVKHHKRNFFAAICSFFSQKKVM